MKRYALLFFIIFASAPFAKAEKKVFTCEVCGTGSTTVEADSCGAPQDTTVETTHTGNLGTLYFGQFSLEVWGVENERPRMELHDDHRRIGAVGEIDSASNRGVVQILDTSTRSKLVATAFCHLKK